MIDVSLSKFADSQAEAAAEEAEKQQKEKETLELFKDRAALPKRIIKDKKNERMTLSARSDGSPVLLSISDCEDCR